MFDCLFVYKILLTMQMIALDLNNWAMGFIIYKIVVSFTDLNSFYVSIVYCTFVSFLINFSKRKELFKYMNI